MTTEPSLPRSGVEGAPQDRPTRLVRWFGWILPRRGWVAALALLWGVAGVAAFATLRRDLFPDLSLPSVNVLIQSPGRAAAELELAVAQPVEQALSGLPGVRRVVTTVQAEVIQVVVAFESGTDPRRSRQLVAERLAGLSGDLPEGTRAPLLTSAAGRLQEIQEIVLEGPSVDPMVLRDLTERVLVPRLQAVRGVARVERLGGGERQLQVTLIPERMRLLEVGLEAIVAALEGSERDLAAGVLEIEDKGWFLTVGSLAAAPADVRRLPLATPHGVVTVGDVAEVREAPAFRRGIARHQGHEDVSLRVVKQPAADTLLVADGVRTALAELRAGLPEGTSLTLMYDQGALVRRALGGVTNALLLGAALVALVLVLLLGNLRGALVVVAVLPLATLGAALPLKLLGSGLNAMTLGGLAIAVGLLVDAAVIMVENLVHRLAAPGVPGDEAGRRAVLTRAAAEVGAPIVTAVLVVLAVFIPLVSIGGVAGRLYTPLAVAVASAMTISLALSFTLVPVLAERVLPPGASLVEPRLVAAVKRVYRPALAWALRHGLLVRAVALALTVPSVLLAGRLGTDFLPTLDERALMIQSSLPSETSLAAVDEANAQLESDLLAVPGVSAVYRRTGRGELTEDPMPYTLSDVLVILGEDADARAVARTVSERIEALPFSVEMTTPMQMRIAEGIGGTPADVQLKLFHPDLAALAAALPRLAERISRLPGVASVAPDSGGPLPKWQVTPDDDALRRLGVPRPLVALTLRAALQGVEAGARFDGPQRVGRVVRFPGDGRASPELLKRLPIVLGHERVVELGQVARFVEESTPGVIRREAGERRLALNVAAAGDLAGAARRVERAAREAGRNGDLPKGTAIRIGGKVEEARETGRRLLVAIAAALGLVVGLLYVALGRWREVFVVFATLPDAFAGGLLALWLAGETWNVSSIVGVIGLFGVAVQNSLVLITQAKQALARGLPFEAALEEAALSRVRPKLMTAGAAILGLLPLLFGLGGSELERPLALVMVGGLVTSTLFTLLALPSFYAWIGPGAPSGPALEARLGSS